MNAIDDRVRAAREQYALVMADPSARDRFVAAFPGAGDPIAALIDASGLTSVSEDERRRLDRAREVAFGRPDPGGGEAAVIEARQTLADAEARRVANVVAVDCALELLRSADQQTAQPTVPPSLPDSPLPADETGPPRPWRRIWILPIILVSIAIGYVGGMMTGSAEPSVAVSPSPSIRPTVSPEPFTFLTPPSIHPTSPDQSAFVTPPPEPPLRPGDPVAASHWFDEPASVRDQVNQPSLLESMGIDPSNVRVAQVLTTGFAAWVATKPDGSWCLIGGGGGEAFGTCVTAEQFIASGIRVADGRHLVDWDGRVVSITPAVP